MQTIYLGWCPPPPYPPSPRKRSIFPEVKLLRSIIGCLWISPFPAWKQLYITEYAKCIATPFDLTGVPFLFFFFNRVTIYRAFLMSYKTKRSSHKKKQKHWPKQPVTGCLWNRLVIFNFTCHLHSCFCLQCHWQMRPNNYSRLLYDVSPFSPVGCCPLFFSSDQIAMWVFLIFFLE